VASINDLVAELKTLVGSVSTVADKGFSIHSMEELEKLAGYAQPPLVGVVYNGAERLENSVVGVQENSSAVFVAAYFTVVVVMSYQYMTDADTKVDALSLLDELRAAILGYQGVNTRPWRFNGEQPLGSDSEGLIYYGQTWETRLPMTSNN